MKTQQHISGAIIDNFHHQVEFLRRLVHTSSANPFTPDTSSPDVPIELEAARLVEDELEQLGFSVEIHGVSMLRPNVVCHIPGSGETNRTLILNAHMDTVEPTDYTRDPWGAQIEQGRLYGVGAADAKAQISAFIYAMYALRRAGIELPGNVTLAFVVDEEAGACSLYGTHYLLEQGYISGDAAIVGEPGSDKISIAHRGLYRFRLQTHGEAVHTGLKAWEQQTGGRSAILDMARVILALKECQLPDFPSPAFPGRKSILTFPTLIQGGSGINIVPASCEGYGDVRLLPGLTAGMVREIIEARLADLSDISYKLEDVICVPAMETASDSRIVQALKESCRSVIGKSPRIEGCGPACDGWMFSVRGIPTVCGYGVAHGGVHGPDEWADLESLRTITEVYAQAVMRFFDEDGSR
jgi:succinyl-diaminopimelate desuccinylase